MSVWVWIGITVAAIVVIYFAIYAGSPKDDAILVLDGSQKAEKTYSSPALIRRSFNEKEGAVFTWAGWLLINDFTVGYGNRRRIFSKGDCPGLYIDSTSNSLIVVINTYGVTPETILVPNIPAMKWINFAIVVDQTSVSIYINGTLRIYHTMTQLPKQNSDVATFGGQWEGVIGNVRYYSRALSNAEVFMKSSETPPDDFQKKPGTGRYFDLSWYTGRL
jgi:hypothetical protein